MIHTIIIVTCTIINCVLGFFWINELNKQIKERKENKIRAFHLDMCSCSIAHGICPIIAKCAWVMI